MRTTLSIDDDVLEAARQLSLARHIPLGQAVSSLARKGITRIGLRETSTGVLVFDTPEDFPAIDASDVERALAHFP